MDAIIIEGIPQTAVSCIRLEDNALTLSDEVEEYVSDKGNALA